jgi:hypothetical protein
MPNDPTSSMPMPISINISALLRTIVNHEISLILETRVYQPLVISCHGVRLYPRISTRSTENVGEISRPTGVSKRVRRSRPWLNRLVCGVPNLRNGKSPTSTMTYICNLGAKWSDGK